MTKIKLIFDRSKLLSHFNFWNYQVINVTTQAKRNLNRPKPNNLRVKYLKEKNLMSLMKVSLGVEMKKLLIVPSSIYNLLSFQCSERNQEGNRSNVTSIEKLINRKNLYDSFGQTSIQNLYFEVFCHFEPCKIPIMQVGKTKYFPFDNIV